MSSLKTLSTKRLRTAVIEQVRQSGIDIIEEDFISVASSVSEEVRQKVIELSAKDIYCIFTSANAVDAVADIAKHAAWKIFCISGNTREAIETNFTSAHIMDLASNATALAKTIIDSGVREVVFFCGDHRREELPSILETSGLKIDELIVYKTIETPVKINEQPDALLFFSPSAVTSFFSVNQLSAFAICFAIGNTTAEAIKVYCSNTIIVADTPSQEAVAASLINYYKQPVQS
jgi:uroporphyrinogen-III synthase